MHSIRKPYFFKLFLLMVLVFFLAKCSDSGSGTDPDVFQLLKVSVDGRTISSSSTNSDISIDAQFEIEFTSAVDTASAVENISITETESGKKIDLTYSFENEVTKVLLSARGQFEYLEEYELLIGEELQSEQGATFADVSYVFETKNGTYELVSASLNNSTLITSQEIRNVPYDEISLGFTFSEALNPQNYQTYFNIYPSVATVVSLSDDSTTVTITNSEPLDYYTYYTISISDQLTSQQGFETESFTKAFQTGLNEEPKFSTISDSELLDKVQEATFQYFWEFAHPVSGLARERNTSGDLVTIGGSGFGVMAILVGIERGFISRDEGITRLETIVDFLQNEADRFHGAWPHWLSGTTGETIPFSTEDDGADLVETAFLAQGLIAVRQYLDENDQDEGALIDQINNVLSKIEWSWFTRGGQNVLYWHWSPNYEWAMNMQIRGYNEALIIYVLAATSSTYGIDSEVYHQGWANSGRIINGREFYGINLPVGFDYGGPLFFSHYSFLGLDPRNLSDQYADYWTQNTNHSLINREHSIVNPSNYVGYSEDSWGITASDDPFGYLAHEPTRDNGTITPTAALSSMPYTPEESMDALRHFYYILGDKLWGDYGFYDAYNPTESWWASSYLAIDQGPIVVMIENYRSGLIWELFMSAPEVQAGLDKLGFSYSE